MMVSSTSMLSLGAHLQSLRASALNVSRSRQAVRANADSTADRGRLDTTAWSRYNSCSQ